MEVAALGDVPNTAARMTSMAATGEIMVSEATIAAAKMDTQGMERRDLAIKGRDKGITAFVM
jgi:class 3 adenylate cyclase